MEYFKLECSVFSIVAALLYLAFFPPLQQACFWVEFPGWNSQLDVSACCYPLPSKKTDAHNHTG